MRHHESGMSCMHDAAHTARPQHVTRDEHVNKKGRLWAGEFATRACQPFPVRADIGPLTRVTLSHTRTLYSD